MMRAWFALVLFAFPAAANTNPPPVSVVRSFTNDMPSQPLVSVSLYGASNVTCVTYEEILPVGASATNMSGDGVWLPSLNTIRWGPYLNVSTLSVSYRLTGLPASYSVNGGSWMDGQWYFSPGTTLVTVLPSGGSNMLAPLPQVATPVFAPDNGTGVPTNVTISCSTTGALIYYTLDGRLPTQDSIPYTGAVSLATASVVRAVAFTNGWTPSVAALANYGPPATLANAQVTRSINTNSPTAPLVIFNVVPGTNAVCVTLTETLPPGVAATNVLGGGLAGASVYPGGGYVVQWGPFIGSNALSLSYQAIGPPGVYPARASWSVDGLGGSEATGTNIVIQSATGLSIPKPPPQVASPTFTPASGGNVPVSVTVTDGTPGALIYYTLDGSLPTPSSTLYTGAVYLASASVIRAAAFTNGWTPSVAVAADYGPPAASANAQVTRTVNTGSPTAPIVTFGVTPAVSATCVAVTETLPPGIGAINVSAGGNYIASDNVVLWGPFIGSNALSLSYQAVGPPGVYPVRASWSVDGVGGAESTGTNLLIASATGGIPTPPEQVPTPVLTPAIASNLPMRVSITCSDGLAQIYYTIDGTLPTQSSIPYSGPVLVSAQTTLRAAAFHSGYLPSIAAVGEYVPALNISTVSLPQSVSGNGSFVPTVSLSATPQSGVGCYAVVEPIPSGLTPSALSGDGIWDPLAGEIRWGPYLDDQPRLFSFNVSGPSGTYPLAAEVSFNGYSAAATGLSSVQINDGYIGPQPETNPVACATDYLSYTVDINPAPGVVTVTSASGTVSWGDNTQSEITNAVMTFEHSYAAAGDYSISVSANWLGYTGSATVSGVATRTDSVQVVTNCNPPEIVTQPSNQVALAGATVRFTVSASSSVEMYYQWYFDQEFPIVGPSSSQLSLADLTLQSAGKYSVLITNAFGSITSSPATLTVVAPLLTNFFKTNGNFTLSFVGLPNTRTRLWATTNLNVPAAWQPIFTNTVTTTNGTWQYTDTNAVRFSERYYRFSTP